MKKIFIGLLSLMSISSLAGEPDQRMTYNMQRATDAVDKGDYDEALEYLDKELSKDNKNGYAYLLKTIIYGDKDELGRALSASILALKNLPKKDKETNSLVYGMQSDIYCEIGDTVKALEDLSKAIKLSPKSDLSYANRGRIYYKQKKYDLSDADYKKLISLNKKSKEGFMGLGLNRAAQKMWDEAIKQFNAVIDIDSTYSLAYSCRAESYLAKKEWDKASDDILKALEIDVDDNAFSMIQNLEEAPRKIMVSKLLNYTAKDPQNAEWPYYNGIIHEQNAEYKAAIDCYEESNRRDLSPVMLERIANCYFNLGQFNNSVTYANKALNLDPQCLTLLALRASSEYELDNMKEAIVQWDSILADNPYYDYGYYDRARTKMTMDDIEGAIEDLTVSITIDPTISAYYSPRAYLYQKLGKDKLAKQDFSKITELEKTPDDYVCSFYAYYALGDSQKAIEVMDTVLARDTTFNSYYSAACLYSRMNRLDDALRYLEKSFQKGLKNFVHLNYDYDMDPIRDLPEYKAMVKKYQDIAKENSISSGSDSGQSGNSDVVEIPFSKETGGNLYNVKCIVNDLPLSFVYDAESNTATLSQIEATFMIKNGYASKIDIVGTPKYFDKAGNVVEGNAIVIKKISFEGLELTNVKATVVAHQKSSLILGQTVLGRLGKIEIDNGKHVLRITKESSVKQ